MAPKNLTMISLLVSFNFLFFTLVTSTYVPCPPPPHKAPKCPEKCHKYPPSTPFTPSPPSTPSTPSTKPTCPRDALMLGVCANVLNGLLNLVIGTPPVTPCCTLIQGLADLEAAVCLCTAIRANLLGINLNVPVSLSLLLNYCGKNVPREFQCA